ncbi:MULTISPECIES: hypothetical protein [unclassified Flavobacterium]|uniref:hypothetical protein n=1 Tax=unclassified Flavobacterium TaxID=196869 RepID=UPI0012923D10|nr:MULTISPECIES: hypothetical protein [unclassified Flavobacterium]MQP51930.1 hypothetical protein [Flavobacterium sp. LMO9]MQP61799.1 hypothetical protein [Flavobacterium sp. LMO6]
MKIVKLFKLLLVCATLFSSSLVSAQQLSKPEEITPQFLKETFEAAFITIEEVGDTYIKVKDTYSVFIDIDPSKRFVTLSGIYRIVDGAKKDKVMDLMNKINGEVALVKAVYSEKSNNFGYYYYFFTEGGFTKKSLIGAFKLYITALDLSLKKDTDKLIK